MTSQDNSQVNPPFGMEILPTDFQDSEIVSDPLYGLVSISLFEKRILNSREFQRLRNIKQLGFAHLVYAGAEHSRFVHSIGVCHQSKRIVDRINRNLRSEPRYAQYRLFGFYDERRKAEFQKDNLPLISPHERVVIAAAALVHDIPHAAFSHEIEGVPKISRDGIPIDHVVPKHDDADKNPALFMYLFHPTSQLAQVIKVFNRSFFNSLRTYYTDLKTRNRNEILKQLDVPFLDLLESNVTEDGYVKIARKQEQESDSILYAAPDECLDEFKISGYDDVYGLPILGVMIFEIHLFEKQKDYILEANERARLLDDKNGSAKKVLVSWDDGRLIKSWKPLKGWFRAFRKDIIGNTICADLIDYVNRDGYHTGIVSEIDLKFLDRMLIAREIMPQDNSKREVNGALPASRFAYEQIPAYCEHVAFDVFDHKRGCLRQSVFTEILSYLQARYLLCERVYTHRVVEGARAMLQALIGILV